MFGSIVAMMGIAGFFLIPSTGELGEEGLRGYESEKAVRVNLGV